MVMFKKDLSDLKNFAIKKEICYKHFCLNNYKNLIYSRKLLKIYNKIYLVIILYL